MDIVDPKIYAFDGPILLAKLDELKSDAELLKGYEWY
jgi:hypothetical protein